VLFFWVSIMFVFWLGTLGAKKAAVGAKVPVPGGAPEPAH
jgi:cytochrome d ubiquinol oxidase subunit I